jgi:8-oxo-dGTP diphosphatase
VIFTVREAKLHVLLIQMKKKPFTGRWAMPGGLLDDREKSEDAARRILKTQTGLGDVYLEQLATFDDPKRDPIGRVASIAHFALVPHEGVRLRTSDKYEDVRWWPVDHLPPLAYDHVAMLAYAVNRVRAKLQYANVAWSLLPEEFTLSALQSVYESILGRSLDKRNFRKKILALDLLTDTGKRDRGGAHRPAALYRFRSRKTSAIALF